MSTLWLTIGRAPKADSQSSYEISGLQAKRVQQVRVDDGRADAQRAIACHELGLAGPESADVGEGAVKLLE